MPVIVRMIRPPEHPERAGRDAVPAPVTDVVLQINVAELVVDQGPGRAGDLAGGLLAVLADVAEYQPARLARPLVDLLLERDVPPRGRTEEARVVIRVSGELKPVRRQLVPLLARHLTRLAPDAER